MPLWEGFLDCWRDFIDRSDHHKCILDYLKTQDKYTKPETTKHVLSIGPGTGEIDHGLVSLLPHLSSYTAVEPDAGMLDRLKGRMEEFSTIEKHYVNGTMQTYTGPPHGAEIILMAHVGYYFSDCFTQQIGRALSWLNNGGRILLIHSQDTVTKLIASEFDVQSDTYDRLLVEDIRGHLVDMGVKFTESVVESHLDMSYPGPTYYGFLSVILNWRASKEEVEKALAVLRPAFSPGTEKMVVNQLLFAIENTPNIHPK